MDVVGVLQVNAKAVVVVEGVAGLALRARRHAADAQIGTMIGSVHVRLLTSGDLVKAGGTSLAIRLGLEVLMMDQKTSSSANPTRVKSFPPIASAEDIERRFGSGLPVGSPDRDQRAEWASMLARLMVRVAQLRLRKARGRNIANLAGRLAAGVTAAVTTVTGGTLLAHVHGSVASALGLIAVVLGVIAAAIAAARPSESYATDLVIAAKYERLWWDMYGFGVTELTTVSQVDFLGAWSIFVNREEDISSSLGVGSQLS